ncbi:EscU/YscU/HrcU family type III secretion system export apparatus switch protein [Epibacterium ulvae]|uniref:EscU/YscU/HrcU family type III secretion system export apparatus switch protein n=1 Tax=Epibacterium ulvae TaxID=1156985 RepID=UPI002492C578|nr:EscU/YscU/HrcU family type III secretion system export apparatus switch protein [Epibacterium ulvae]
MSGEKTEEPTQKKLDDAREKGQVAPRKNILEALILITGFLGIYAMWNGTSRALSDVFDASLDGIHLSLEENKTAILEAAPGPFTYTIALTIFLAILVTFVTLLLNRFNFAPKALQPKFEKFNPVNGLKGMFSKNTLYNFGRSLSYFIVCGLILYFMIKRNIPNMVQASYCGERCIIEFAIPIILTTVAVILSTQVVLAFLDFKAQTAMFMKQMKMTKDEVKREHKGQEGDPMIKSTRKQIAREDAEMPSMNEVTHVVFSNSHLVAVIYYEGAAPYVVMKVKGKGILKLVQKFKSHGAECVNLPSVAHDFYRVAKIGKYITDTTVAKGMARILFALEKKRRR